MKIFNNYIYTQIRIDLELRQLLRIVCATEGIDTRMELCEKLFNHFLNIGQETLIAPVRRGILFRVELPQRYYKLLMHEVSRRNTTTSRLFHTAMHIYTRRSKAFSKSEIQGNVNLGEFTQNIQLIS